MKTITIDGIEYELKPVAQAEKPSGKRWRAELGKKHYSIDSCGVILIYTEENSKYDNYAYASGNYYKTVEEAERARDKQLALVRVTDKLREIEAAEGWVADWDNNEQVKYYVAYNNKYSKFIPSHCTYLQGSSKEMYSYSNAIDYIIKHMQDDLKLIFGVEK